MSPRRRDPVIASDGLIARENGAWARDKLSFIDQFVPAALQATKRKVERHYLDLFAGPGMNVDPESREEFDGAVLRALATSAQADPELFFSDAMLVNLDGDEHEALKTRVAHRRERGEIRTEEARTRFWNGDANAGLPQIMRDIPRQAYVFAFADLEAPDQWPWSSVLELHRHGHTSVDLYVLFPLGMALNRMASYEPETVEQCSRVLDRFYGNSRWHELIGRRVTNAQSPELRRGLTELYLEGLRSQWRYASVVREILRPGSIQSLYVMILASDHPVGETLGEWSRARHEQRTQYRLPLED